MPVTHVVLPLSSRAAFGSVSVAPHGPQGKLLCLPEAGHFRADDTRKLVRMPPNSQGDVWMACRHFLQVLRFACSLEDAEPRHYTNDLLSSLLGFRMYGEAEALCEWLIGRGRRDQARRILKAAVRHFPSEPGIARMLRELEFPH